MSEVNTMQTLVEAIIQEKGNIVRRKDIMNIGAARGYKMHDVWKHICRADMRSSVRGQFDMTKYNGGPAAKVRRSRKDTVAAAPKANPEPTTEPSTPECL